MQEAEENVKELIKNMLLSEGFTEERIHGYKGERTTDLLQRR